MQKKNHSFYAILGFLHQKPLTGYEIRKLVEQSVQHFWHESEGHLYPTLKKMNDLGLIFKLEPNKKSASKRKTIRYQITDDGRDYFQQWLMESLEPRKTREELMLKIFFCQYAESGVLLKHLSEQQQRAKQKLAFLKQVYEYIKDDPAEKYPLITVDFGIAMLQAKYDWLTKTINEQQENDNE